MPARAATATMTGDVPVATPTAYDAIPYPGHAHAETHPNRVAAIARLFGLDPPSVATARILEIACGDGANLIPIAGSLPRSRCVGFDLAQTAVDRARARIERLQLPNVEITVADLTTVQDLGEFDYVIAHGLYSWVPAPVRDALLRLVSTTLALRGIAFVSYNVYPGWHVAGMVRGMLRYHTRGLADADARVTQARALLDFLLKAHDAEDPYGRLLAAESARLCAHSPGYLLHDDLAEVNEPVYFEEFVAHAAAFELGFVAEADYATMAGADLPDFARAKLDELSADPVARGQYLDFVRCRRFRESLLGYARTPAAAIPVPGRVRTLFAATAAVPDTPVADPAEEVEVQFRLGDRASLRTASPLAKAVLLVLQERWPEALAFEALLSRACALLGRAPSDSDADAVQEVLLAAFGLRMVELTVERWNCAVQVSKQPCASRLARHDASMGDVLTNLMHRRLRIDEEDARRLVTLCDGTRTREALHAALRAGGSALDRDGIRQRLQGLVKLALLEPGPNGGSPPRGDPSA